MNQQTLEQEEMKLLREQMLKPEELFLLQYLKSADRRASQKLQEVYGWDASAFPEE